VAQFIESGAADIGFSAKSIVVSDEMKGKGKWIDVDSTKYDPLPQAAVVLVYGENNNSASAHKLFDFLYTNESKQILLRYGYNVP
jgi:molybdate transport system substrate-binding protein